MSFNASD
jgi:hypothetical protein